MRPGEILPLDRDIVLNEGKETRELMVANMGDRPVQVGSHFHFFEVNRCLEFDRKEAFGFRLDIPSGTSVRFEPGETRRTWRKESCLRMQRSDRRGGDSGKS